MAQWKTIVINLSENHQTKIIKDFDISWAGRGFTSRWINQKVDAKCEPLGANNDLVFSVGLLAGSGVSSSTRLSIGSKSPLTKGIKESNTGGNAGHGFAKLGMRALILQGQCENWNYIYISKKEIKVISASSLLGKNIFETTGDLQKIFDNKVAIISIGSAGERSLAAASIGITDIDGVPSRHAARGGLAAVMGSKKIKAIVLDSKNSSFPKPFDADSLKKAKTIFTKALIAHPTTGSFLSKYGTAGLLEIINEIGGLPTRNYSLGKFDDAEKINGKALYELIINRRGRSGHPCMPGCVIRCSNIIPDEDGKELNRALEYETITLLGSNCGINDLDTICRLNRRCDDIGLDTIEIGSAIAVAMEAGLAEFGDGGAALRFLDEIDHGSDLGLLIGNGSKAVGEYYNVKRVPTVKGQSMAAYDPRVLKGTGVTYATSPMGADHTAGNALPNTKLPNGKVPITTKKEDQVELSSYLQHIAMIFDSLGLCWFARPPVLEDFTLITDIIEAQHGNKMTYEMLYDEAQTSLKNEIDFNKQAGLPYESDLPSFFRDEPLPPTNNVFDVDLEDLKNIHNYD